MAKWYAVQETRNDPWDYGSEDYCIAVEMLREQGHGLIAVIENHTCVEEIEMEDLPAEEHMDREQVIRELTVLMEAFKEERGAHPVYIEEAIRLLKEDAE